MKRDRWQEISQLYCTALDLPESERTAFLDKCGDEDLQREVRALLADEPRLKDFLEDPALEVASRLKTKEKPSLVGMRLGSYHIVSELGAGGMGDVYLAKDQTLEREVAIKFLPEEFARDPDRVARFQREAKVLASLNHPNIASIHGLEKSGGTNFLVLEFVEGEALAEQLKRGPLPVEEALKLALQITEALEAAHEKGVIHRDIKPANIKVTPEGKVKVLDFGLAKALAREEEEQNLSNSPTLGASVSHPGVILGTAAYMSPEQARGKPVDKRADIWGFGCVLFEMLTGCAAFSGKDVTEILSAVIRAEPDWNCLPPDMHGRVREVLERCLTKERKDRYHDISDVRIDLQKVLTDPGGVFMQPATRAEVRSTWRRILPWVAAAGLLGAIAAGIAVWKLKPAPPVEPRQVTRLFHELPQDQHFGRIAEVAIAVSPDGRRLVYRTNTGLYSRSMDELEAKLIPGSEANAVCPFFSPDGKWVGYWSEVDNRLKKIVLGGGAPVTLADVSLLGSPSWGEDNKIVFGTTRGDIMRVSADGGIPERIIRAAENEDLLSPQVLPDGKSVLFTRTMPLPFRVMVQSLESGERKDLFRGDSARYLPTGHIVYTLENNLYAIPFNLGKLEAAGGPFLLVQGVSRDLGPQYAVSDSGTLVYVPGTAVGGTAARRTLVWVDRNGREDPLAAAPNAYTSPRISPDGTRVALNIGSLDRGDIWIWDIARETMNRLTFETGDTPIWTPDGRRIAYESIREGLFSIYWKAADGVGEDEQLCTVQRRRLFPCAWSNDAKTLVTLETGDYTNWGIGMMSMESGRARKALLQNGAQPSISPNGRWMAYTSNESGQNQIYMRPFPEVLSGSRWQVSTNGGNSPRWSRDGQELFYRNRDEVVAVPVKTDPGFSLDAAKVLFRGSYVSADAVTSTLDLNSWDVSPDGKRFLMIKELASAGEASAAGPPRRINVVLNWFEELNQRVPMK